jgi:TRAP-type transport system periplasmic protein
MFTRKALAPAIAFAAGAVLISAAQIFGAGTARAEEWKCYTYMPSPTHPSYVGLEKIAEDMEQISGGSITAQCSVGGALPIKSDTIAQAVGDGVLDLAGSGFDTGYVPVAGLFSVPGLFSNEDELEKGYQAALPILTEEFAKRNIVLLGAYHYPRQVIWSTEDIPSLDDLKGVKVRANSPENAEFIKRFGGIPVTMATPDVAPALQRGVFPAVITAAAGAGQLWVDMLRYINNVGPSYTVSFVIVGKTAFDALSPDQQTALRAAAAEQTAWISGQMRDQNATLMDKFQTEGLTVVAATPEEEAEIVTTMKPYWTEWADARGEPAKLALDAARAAIGK